MTSYGLTWVANGISNGFGSPKTEAVVRLLAAMSEHAMMRVLSVCGIACPNVTRDDEGAIGLWHSLPERYLDAQTYVDFWNAYDAIFYADKLHHVAKDSGQTNHIERFNNTLRQRCSRLVRKTLSFSKKLANHIAAIWNFIHHYNSSLLL